MPLRTIRHAVGKIHCVGRSCSPVAPAVSCQRKHATVGASANAWRNPSLVQDLPGQSAGTNIESRECPLPSRQFPAAAIARRAGHSPFGRARPPQRTLGPTATLPARVPSRSTDVRAMEVHNQGFVGPPGLGREHPDAMFELLLELPQAVPRTSAHFAQRIPTLVCGPERLWIRSKLHQITIKSFFRRVHRPFIRPKPSISHGQDECKPARRLGLNVPPHNLYRC